MNKKPFHGISQRFAMLICGALSVLPLGAQTNPPPDRSSRFLFIVDTSSAMRRRAPAVEKAVENLLHSGMAAQLAAGDTVGVWTFDEQLYAGRFPLQLWSPERAELVSSNVVAFLKSQRYQKQGSRFEVVVPALQRIVQESSRLTILLVSDGDEKIYGTPFDRQIEGAFANKFKDQQKARMPFITVLRSMRGQFRNAIVNLAPWPVEFPEFPPEPKIVEAPKPKPPEPKPAPRPVVPSLILIGKKPEPPIATNTIAIASTPTTATNPPVKVEATPPTITPMPPQLNPSEIKPTPAPTLTPTEVVTKLATSTATSTNPIAPPVAQPVAPVPAPGVETNPSQPIQSPTTNRPVVAAPVAPVPEVPQPAAASSPRNEVAPANPTPHVALAVQPEPGFNPMGLVAIAIALLLLASGLFFILQRRARHAAQASLITRSMDRDRK